MSQKRPGYKRFVFATSTVWLFAACSEGDPESATNLLAAAAVTSAEPVLRVQIRMDKPTYERPHPVGLTFEITNISNAVQKMLYWSTPVGGEDVDVFSVTAVDTGKEAPYVGPLYKRRGVPIDSDFISLSPGASLTAHVDLARLYDLSEGKTASPKTFSVRFNKGVTDSLGIDLPLVTEGGQFELRPGSAKFDIVSSAAVVNPTGTNSFTSCSASQQQALKYARENALLLAQRAYNTVNKMGSGDRTSSTWATRWFGAYNSSRWATVDTNLNKILSAFYQQNFQFFCDCTTGSFAWVVKSDPYKIHLCNAFWTAGVMGTDSQAGTLVHETSHFNVVASTDDYAYGQTACMNLASTNPGQAIDNADSYEYFAEGSLGTGFMMVSDANPNLAVSSTGVHLGNVQLSNSCNISNANCRWSLRDGMIVSDANPSLAINAVGGAQFGTVLQLHDGCSSNNPDCTWTYDRGMWRSDANQSLVINAWGGAANGTVLRLHNACDESNGDCTWSINGLMLTPRFVGEYGLNAYAGASDGGEIRIHQACTSSNNDCKWNYVRGRLLSAANTNLAIKPQFGTNGSALILNSSCPQTSSSCRWSYKTGPYGKGFFNDFYTSYGVQPNSMASTSVVKMGTCTNNLYCQFWGEMKQN